MNALLNVAGWDRIARLVLGAALIAIAFAGLLSAGWTIALGVAAAILMVTGTLGFCPIYHLLKFRTLKRTSPRTH